MPIIAADLAGLAFQKVLSNKKIKRFHPERREGPWLEGQLLNLRSEQEIRAARTLPGHFRKEKFSLFAQDQL